MFLLVLLLLLLLLLSLFFFFLIIYCTLLVTREWPAEGSSSSFYFNPRSVGGGSVSIGVVCRLENQSIISLKHGIPGDKATR
ncbi:MAG: hypothetical protein J3R72DRAFT_461696 [Linnemannia gamsii]|nr:MAG: hypothetical protein J3R72DRAFT_461696 [Linnemannia gamsii]